MLVSVVKMATVLKENTEQQCSLLRFFLRAKWLSAQDIHKEIFPLYSGKCLSRKAVHNWAEKFSQGHSKVADDARPGYDISWEGHAYRILGFSGSTICSFSEAW
jgi:hypothetical protein